VKGSAHLSAWQRTLALCAALCVAWVLYDALFARPAPGPRPAATEHVEHAPSDMAKMVASYRALAERRGELGRTAMDADAAAATEAEDALLRQRQTALVEMMREQALRDPSAVTAEVEAILAEEPP
jgi:hypothetical protein